MDRAHFLPDEKGNTERPPLITGLGVITMVNCVLFMVMYVLGLIAMLFVRTLPMDRFEELLKLQMEQFAGMFPPEELAMMDDLAVLLHDQGAVLMALLLLRTTMRFVGVLGMWKGRRNGFFTYATAQLGGIFLPLVVLPPQFLGVLGPILAVGFTAIYGTQVKRMV